MAALDRARHQRRARQPALYAIPFTLVGFALALPWTIYTAYFREKKYGLVNQGFAEWAGEQGIALGRRSADDGHLPDGHFRGHPPFAQALVAVGRERR